MAERMVIGTDNRCMTETFLKLDDGNYVEVDPCDLFQNMLANAGMTQEQFDQVISYLDTTHTDLVRDMNDGGIGPEIPCGLEWILQGLKVPGYEFT